MPVATVPAYEDMWVNPQVVAALSNGVFTYTEVDPWADDVAYPQGSLTLYGPGVPFGGYVWTATQPIPAGAAPPGDHPFWALNETATADRLVLFTATTQATWLLDTLTGYTLHGIEHWQEDYRVHTCTVRLRRFPVSTVHTVTRILRCNTPTDELIDWCHKSQQQISVCCNGGNYSTFNCGCDNNVLRVVYTIGANLPPGTEALAAWLAGEYGKAAQGNPCALPERITSVTRQGVSWTVLDPQDFLDKGYTGMSRVDHLLSPIKLTIGGTMIDPLTSNRLFTQRLEELPVEPEEPEEPGPEPVVFGYGEGLYGVGPYGGTP